ncbi:unnamed protein product [Somion occarium]|uniref:Uncharacterized protein n=1 Tax=Somion occarium TaxID=3059160 RepID=A0ABP1D2I8_9APHY
MDFTNINDPAGIKALLERLRSAQAWQPPVSTSSSAAPSDPLPPPPPAPASTSDVYESVLPSAASHEVTPSLTSAVPTASVASLLSQLQASIPPATTEHISDVAPYHPETHSSAFYKSPEPAVVTPPSIPQKQDVRGLSFQQSLPLLARLAEHPKFMEAISAMKQEQAKLEKKLWDERNAILASQEEKVKAAKTKANMIGAGLTKFEADTMTDNFRRELAQFDLQRALPAWDGLLAKQQTALETLGVPTIFATSSKADRERQQRVIQVLTGFDA